ncbi:2222_t:CDS:1, partial [Acaulospora colombiana]
VPIYLVSVKKGWHVSDAFEDLLRQMRIRYPVYKEAQNMPL